MKQLTWLAAERRLCGDRDSDEDHSPTSPGSQEEEEEEEEGNKDQGSGEGRTIKSSLDKEVLHSKRAPKRGGRCPKRGRGQLCGGQFLCVLCVSRHPSVRPLQITAVLAVVSGVGVWSAAVKMLPSCCCCMMRTSWTTTPTETAKTQPSPTAT